MSSRRSVVNDDATKVILRPGSGRALVVSVSTPVAFVFCWFVAVGVYGA
jgi:hypothetical protein